MSVVAGVTKAVLEEKRNRLVNIIGSEYQNDHFRLSLGVLETDSDILARCASTHEIEIGLDDLNCCPDRRFRSGHHSIDQISKQRHDLRASYVKPFLRSGNRFPFGRDKRRREIVRGDLLFIHDHIKVVVFPLICAEVSESGQSEYQYDSHCAAGYEQLEEKKGDALPVGHNFIH